MQAAVEGTVSTRTVVAVFSSIAASLSSRRVIRFGADLTLEVTHMGTGGRWVELSGDGSIRAIGPVRPRQQDEPVVG